MFVKAKETILDKKGVKEIFTNGKNYPAENRYGDLWTIDNNGKYHRIALDYWSEISNYWFDEYRGKFEIVA